MNDSTPVVKVCKTCGEAKPKTQEFFTPNGVAGRFRPECKQCSRKPRSAYLKPGPASSGLKKCRTCGERLPATLEQFRPANGEGLHALSHSCRKCVPEKPEGVKVCLQCKQTKPKTREFFRTNGRAGAFKPVCKACTNLPPAPIPPEGKKFCVKCGEAKPATTEHFHTSEGGEGLRGKCKPCAHAETVANQRNNPERTRATRLARYWRDPLKFRLKSTLRHRKLKASGVVTSKDVELKLSQQGGKCYWCGKKLKGRDFHIDHIIPIAKGGPHTPGNICCACQFCNLSKNDKMPHEWAGRLF